MAENTDYNENRISLTERILPKLYSFLKFFFCFFIGAMLLYYIVAPDKDISEGENRPLQKRPSFSLSSFADGSFMDSIVIWLSAQFPLRDKAVSFKTLLDRTLGKKEQNGVYFGKNGFLFEKGSEYDEERVSKTTSSMKKFMKKYGIENSAVIISPNSSEILSDYLPEFVKEESQKEMLSEIRRKLKKGGASWIDCHKILSSEENKEELFFRTDHHWTVRAAYEVFKSLKDKWELDEKGVKFKFHTVTDEFQGTLASSSGTEAITDKIEICMPEKKDLSYVAVWESQALRKATLFDKAKLSSKNKYEVFLGGNFDKIEISTNNDNMKSLLIFKDSYANSMIPMLVPYFSKIVIVDPRYYSDDIDNLIADNDFTHLLFLYNVNTFLEDTSIEKVLD